MVSCGEALARSSINYSLGKAVEKFMDIVQFSVYVELMLQKRNITEQELIVKGQFKFTTKGWYNSLTREWQLRRGNSSRKSWWSGKSTYFVGIFWAWCQLAVSTYLLKHDYSARKDWADSVSITSAVSHLPPRCSLLDRLPAWLASRNWLGTPTRCSSAHFPPWILFLKLHRAIPLFTVRVLIKNSCSKGFWQTLCQILAWPSQNGSHVRGGGGWGVGAPMGKSKSGCDQVLATLFIHFTHWSR